MARVELPVEGMTCNNCVRHVTEALEGVPGVRHAEVSLQDRKATVDADDTVGSDALAAAVEGAGYRAGTAVPVSAATAGAPQRRAGAPHPAVHSIGQASTKPTDRAAVPAHHCPAAGACCWTSKA